MLTQDRLKEKLTYNPETGLFTTVYRDVVGTLTPYGYIRIAVDNKLYLAHRLAWLFMTGAFPTVDIDHINGCRTDNTWANLRIATRAENMCNTPAHKDNTSGYKGVDWSKQKAKWRGRVMCKGKTYYCLSSDIDVCIAFVRELREKIHGSFANHGDTYVA